MHQSYNVKPFSSLRREEDTKAFLKVATNLPCLNASNPVQNPLSYRAHLHENLYPNPPKFRQNHCCAALLKFRVWNLSFLYLKIVQIARNLYTGTQILVKRRSSAMPGSSDVYLIRYLENQESRIKNPPVETSACQE